MITIKHKQIGHEVICPVPRVIPNDWAKYALCYCTGWCINLAGGFAATHVQMVIAIGHRGRTLHFTAQRQTAPSWLNTQITWAWCSCYGIRDRNQLFILFLTSSQPLRTARENFHVTELLFIAVALRLLIYQTRWAWSCLYFLCVGVRERF